MIKLNKLNLIVFLVLAMLVAVSLPVFSMGKADVVPYGITLEEGFGDIAAQLDSGEISLEEAIAALHDLRTSNGRENNPEYGEMERILAAVMEQTMTMAQARLQVCQLDEAAVDCTGDQLQDRLRDRQKDLDQEPDQDKTQARDRDKTQDPDAEADQLKDQDQDQLRDRVDEPDQDRERDRDQDGDCDNDCDGDGDQTQTQTNAGGSGAGAGKK